MRPLSGFQPPQRPQSPFGPLEKSGMPSGISGAKGSDSFASMLGDQVKNVNSMQIDANDMVHTMLTGGEVNEAEVLTAVQKADLAFRMLLQVRNKLVEAYREVQQIQI
ncbi:MAG: flagellar hook-basal body complex protein FliE [Rubripirellula sp.]